jgi:uncharacterized protein YjiS (DUF1127 family)
MTHRALLVQFFDDGAVKNLLFNPSDVEAAKATPFFARLQDRVGKRLAERLQTRYATIEEQLRDLGVSPNEIDYVAFDHFHTQDLRSLLGTEDDQRLPRFPNATLLAPRAEWQAWDDLHDFQRAWFIKDGKRGVKMDRVTLTDRDLALGDGVVLLRTPGHTVGNQSLFFVVDSGIWGVSENGTCVDNWSPHESRIPGLREQARATDVEVLLNANTPEAGELQYTSMMLERTLASRAARAPVFAQMFASSEVTASWLAPGMRATFTHGAITYGSLLPRALQPRASVRSKAGENTQVRP